MALVHRPRVLILVWCLWCFPFTLWDAAYIFLRPHTLPKGKWHEPFFKQMEGWANTDHLYGVEAWEDREGFTAAQGVINVVEVVLYMVYVGMMFLQREGGWRRTMQGRWAARAMLVGFGAGTVTATKTSLYFMREIFSGYKYTGHNGDHPVFTLWGFMNLLYITVSSYMIIAFGRDILNGLDTRTKQAATRTKAKSEST